MAFLKYKLVVIKRCSCLGAAITYTWMTKERVDSFKMLVIILLTSISVDVHFSVHVYICFKNENETLLFLLQIASLVSEYCWKLIVSQNGLTAVILAQR